MGRGGLEGIRETELAFAFVRVVAAHGYERATVARVAEASGLAHSLVHYYFRNKRQMLVAAIGFAAEAHAHGLAAKLRRVQGRTLPQLDAFIDFHFDPVEAAQPTHAPFWLVVAGESLRNDEVRLAFALVLNSLFARLTRILETGVARHEFRCTDPRAAATGIVAAIHGALLVRAVSPERLDAAQAASALKRLARGYIAVAPAQPKRLSPEAVGASRSPPKRFAAQPNR